MYKNKVRNMILAGVFCALAILSRFIFKIDVGFLTFDIKDAITTIGALFLGPVYAIVMSAVVALVEMLTVSGTGPYGMIMNFLASAAFSSTAAFIYSRRKKIAGAFMGLGCAIVVMIIVMLGANLVITPLFVKTTVDYVVKMIPTLLLPFNATKAVTNSAIVFLLYKPVSFALHKARLVPGNGSYKLDLTTVLVTLTALAVGAAGIVTFLLLLNGKL